MSRDIGAVFLCFKCENFKKIFRVHKEYRLILYNKNKKERHETEV